MRTASSHCSRRAFIARGGCAGLGIATTVGGGLFPRVHAAEFRGKESDDRRVLSRAVEAWKAQGTGVLELEPGRIYDLGSVAPGDHVLDLRGLSDATLKGNGATLRCATAGAGKTQTLLVRQCQGLHISRLHGEDHGTDLYTEWRGMDFIHCDASAGAIRDVSLEGITVDRAVSLLSCSGGPGSPRMAGLRLRDCEARNCYYGLSFQENGDDVAGDLRAINCRRAYFPYGVRDHQLALDVHHDGIGPGGDACILIKRYLLDTQDISVRARFAGVLPWRNLLKLEMQSAAGAMPTISDIDAILEVDGTALPLPGSHLAAYGSWRDGRYEIETDGRWSGVRIRGCSGRVDPHLAQLSRTRRTADISLAVDRLSCS